MAERPHVTDLLDAVARGEEHARNELFERVYLELKRIARSQLRRSGDWMSVNPTTLLHEAWLKFSRTDGRELQGSTHFYNILSQAMRHVLTDIARSRVTTKRGHQMIRIELNEHVAPAGRVDLAAAVTDVIDATAPQAGEAKGKSESCYAGESDGFHVHKPRPAAR